jgi:hypothetical protein
MQPSYIKEGRIIQEAHGGRPREVLMKYKTPN